MTRPFAEAADRNSGPIFDVLRLEFANSKSILEIGSGTGQHSACFAGGLPHLAWQPSDVSENLPGISAWVTHAGLPNLPEPLDIDVRIAHRPDSSFDGAFSSNTAHIMHADAVEAMFELVGDVLTANGVFVLYGPVRQQGGYNTQSNAQFDKSLRQRDSGMGIRDLEWLDDLAAGQGMRRSRLYAMPANNHIAVWERDGSIR